MKRIYLLSVCATMVANGFAAGRYGEPELPGWLTFMGIIMIAWGILEIILFFKIWGMTNDIKALKKDHFNETEFETKSEMARYLRKNLLLGNKENVKRILLQNFVDNVEHGFGELPTNGYVKDEKGIDVWTSFREDNLKKSVRPYIENLQKQYDKIGEEVPSYILRMQTFSDCFNLFSKDDLTVEIEKEAEDKKND